MKPFEVSTPISESIIARRVYCNCIVTVCDRDTLDDLFDLDVVDFAVIIGMDWLDSCYAMVDCQSKIVHFSFQKRHSSNGKVILGRQEVNLFLILRQIR